MNPSLPNSEPMSERKPTQTATDQWADQNDQHLLEHIGQGSKAAMSEFITRYYQRIVDFAFRHMSRKADAEDVA
ncbi:MAG: hypothetical protein PVF82_20735, partial [Gammaproteobacteria bacterium]